MGLLLNLRAEESLHIYRGTTDFGRALAIAVERRWKNRPTYRLEGHYSGTAAHAATELLGRLLIDVLPKSRLRTEDGYDE